MIQTYRWLNRSLFLAVSVFIGVACTEATEAPSEAPAADVSDSDDASEELISVKAGHLVALDMAPLFVGGESGCFVEKGLAVETVFFTKPVNNNKTFNGGQNEFSTKPFKMP